MRHLLATIAAVTALGVTLPAAAAPTFLGLFQMPDRPIAWTDAVQVLTQGDVVIVGEQHDDPETHRIELATLEAMVETGRPVALSLEMFEADVQPALDAYLAGTLDEAAFLAQARPWPNYRTDYRPLVTYAKAMHVPVIAANVPRPLAAVVARQGLADLQALPWDQARLAAVPPTVEKGPPWERFQQAMGGHGGAADAMWHLYEAQSLKDSTMARSIARALTVQVPGGRILHVQGRFHSDFGAGVPAYLRQLVPDRPLRVLTVVPVADAGAVSLEDKAGLADVVGFVQTTTGADER